MSLGKGASGRHSGARDCCTDSIVTFTVMPWGMHHDGPDASQQLREVLYGAVTKSHCIMIHREESYRHASHV